MENVTAGMKMWFSDDSNTVMSAMAGMAELPPVLACMQHCIGHWLAWLLMELVG